MGVEPQKLRGRLVGQDHPGFDACFSRFVVKPLDDGEDKSADIREQPEVVAEAGSQELGEGEDELPVV